MVTGLIVINNPLNWVDPLGLFWINVPGTDFEINYWLSTPSRRTAGRVTGGRGLIPIGGYPTLFSFSGDFQLDEFSDDPFTLDFPSGYADFEGTMYFPDGSSFSFYGTFELEDFFFQIGEDGFEFSDFEFEGEFCTF